MYLKYTYEYTAFKAKINFVRFSIVDIFKTDFLSRYFLLNIYLVFYNANTMYLSHFAMKKNY